MNEWNGFRRRRQRLIGHGIGHVGAIFLGRVVPLETILDAHMTEEERAATYVIPTPPERPPEVVTRALR